MNLFTQDLLTKDELKHIALRIAEVERSTMGEIRVSIQRNRPFRDRHRNIYDMAVKNFYSLGMEKTKEKTGVLIYLLLSDRKFQIIGDTGINQKVTKEFWDILAMKTAEHFGQKNFSDGICYAIDEVGAVLKREFPKRAGDTNELPDEVVIS